MSSARKGGAKLQCMLCLSKRSSAHGRSRVLERDNGLLFLKLWNNADINGWRTHSRHSPNGMLTRFLELKRMTTPFLSLPLQDR